MNNWQSKIKYTHYGLAVVLLFAALLGGCFFERLSWSPDGRYLVFTGGEDGKLWRWDSETEKTEELILQLASENSLDPPKAVEQNVVACRHMPN